MAVPSVSSHPLACLGCATPMALPDKGTDLTCQGCGASYSKIDGVWDFRQPSEGGSQESLAIYAEPEFQRWIDIFGRIESKNWKIYETKLNRFFAQAGHRILGRHLSKTLTSLDLVVEVGTGNGALHKFVEPDNYIGIDTNWDMLCQITQKRR